MGPLQDYFFILTRVAGLTSLHGVAHSRFPSYANVASAWKCTAEPDLAALLKSLQKKEKRMEGMKKLVVMKTNVGGIEPSGL